MSIKLPITQAQAKKESVTEARAIAATIDKYEKVLLLSDDDIYGLFLGKFFFTSYCPMCHRHKICDDCGLCPLSTPNMSCCAEWGIAVDSIEVEEIEEARIQFQKLINRLKGLQDGK